MEQLIAKLAQAMAQGQGAGFNPDMMAQAGGATNLPMDAASAERMAQEQMGNQAWLDQITAMMGNWPIGQSGPHGTKQRPVGGPQTNGQGHQPPQNTAQQGDRFQYNAPIDPTGDDYFKNEIGQDYGIYMQMTPDQRLQYLNDPANGFVPPLY